MKKISVFLILISLVIGGSNTNAAEKREIPNTLGLAVAVHDSIYKGKDNTTTIVPLINWRHNRFFINGLRTGVVLATQDSFEFSVFLEPRLMGYDADDSTDLNGMKDRDYSLDAGMQIFWGSEYSDQWTLNTSLSTDLLSKHQGQEISLSLAKLFDYQPFFLKPCIGIAWQSSDLVDYYYGVLRQEATPTRSAYSANDAFNSLIQLDFYMGLSLDWLLISRIKFNFFGHEIRDSSIVDEDYGVTGIIGIARMF